jgi:hypothetical protein
MHRRFHRSLVLATAIAAIAGPALAKDSSKNALTNPTLSSPPFVDCTSSGQGSNSGTKFQYQLKKMQGIADTDGVACSGDEIICVATTMITLGGTSFPTSVVTFGEVKKGGMTVKHDACKEIPSACAPGSTPTYQADLQCFASDGGTFMAAVASNPQFIFSFPTPHTCDKLGFPVSPYVFPASALIARQGSTTNCP